MQRLRERAHSEFHYFYTGRLSMWKRCGFEINGVQFNSVGQYMMYCKAVMFDDQFAGFEILQSSDPDHITELGRQVLHFDPHKWNNHKVDILWQGNMYKFREMSVFQTELFETFPKTIVNADRYDDIMGIGLSEDHPDSFDIQTWRGSNILGLIVTDVRDVLLMKEGTIQKQERPFHPKQLKLHHLLALRADGFEVKRVDDETWDWTSHNKKAKENVSKSSKGQPEPKPAQGPFDKAIASLKKKKSSRSEPKGNASVDESKPAKGDEKLNKYYHHSSGKLKTNTRMGKDNEEGTKESFYKTGKHSKDIETSSTNASAKCSKNTSNISGHVVNQKSEDREAATYEKATKVSTPWTELTSPCIPGTSDNSKVGNQKRRMDRHDSRYHFFWKEKSKFSQWYLSPFNIEKKHFCCTEQYMMFKKAD